MHAAYRNGIILSRPGREPVSGPFCSRARFASRHPDGSNSIGMSIVRLTGRDGNGLLKTGIDVLDRSPLLDIKPYIL